MRSLDLGGVIPAHLLPFTDELAIDEAGLRDHLAWLLDQPIGGITTTAHASEVATCTRAERGRVLEVVLDAVRGRVAVIAGVYADGTAEAVTSARDAERLGADALLVFPSALFAERGRRRDDVVVAHHAAIAAATDLPIVVFEYGRATGCHYGPELLTRLIEEIPAVAGVKEWSLDLLDFRENLEAVRSASRPIAMLSSFSTALLPTLALGADGVLSGHGSVVADLHCELFDAVRRNDLEAARGLDARLATLARVTYRDPFQDGHNRMKYALRALGRIGTYAVRPPLLALDADERAAVERSLEAAGLTAPARA